MVRAGRSGRVAGSGLMLGALLRSLVKFRVPARRETVEREAEALAARAGERLRENDPDAARELALRALALQPDQSLAQTELPADKFKYRPGQSDRRKAVRSIIFKECNPHGPVPGKPIDAARPSGTRPIPERTPRETGNLTVSADLRKGGFGPGRLTNPDQNRILWKSCHR